MIIRKTLTAIALVTAGAAAPAFASGDADARVAQRLVEEARAYGAATTTGQAAGQESADRMQALGTSHDEQRWEHIRKAQSLN